MPSAQQQACTGAVHKITGTSVSHKNRDAMDASSVHMVMMNGSVTLIAPLLVSVELSMCSASTEVSSLFQMQTRKFVV